LKFEIELKGMFPSKHAGGIFEIARTRVTLGNLRLWKKELGLGTSHGHQVVQELKKEGRLRLWGQVDRGVD
jgi:hypothetical protein